MWTATLDPGDLGHLAKPRLEVAELEAKTEQGEFFWDPSLYCFLSTLNEIVGLFMFSMLKQMCIVAPANF